MRVNKAVAVVFTNAHDKLLSSMTESRSIASLPVAGRYRLIDFTLSMLVNAGIEKVGLVTRSNYKSLMDHLGSGKPWDLDRKNGGIYLLPPYVFGESGLYRGHIDALHGAISFLQNSNEEYVVLCDADMVINFDLREMLSQHIKTGADITVAYRRTVIEKSDHELPVYTFDGNNRVKEVIITNGLPEENNYGFNIMIIDRRRLIELVEKCSADNRVSISRDILQPNTDTLKINGYEVGGYLKLIDSVETYVDFHSELLGSSDVRREIFNPKRPVLTKTRDDMPTKYGLDSDVTSSLVADGCRIDGRVKNSVIFRGVTIEKGAEIENCIIMQDTVIGKGASLKYVTADKDVSVGDGSELSGSAAYYLYIPKGKKI